MLGRAPIPSNVLLAVAREWRRFLTIVEAAAEGAGVGDAGSAGRTATPNKLFPESAEAVLARFEAEIEMCEDEMQSSRLRAIHASLVKFAPEGVALVEAEQ